MNTKQYTAVKCFFNSNGEIVRKHYLNLTPMTHKETVTFISKQTNPSNWLVEQLPSYNRVLITPKTLTETYKHFADIQQGCIDEVLNGRVRVNDQKDYISKRKAEKEEYLNMNSSNYTFTFLQRAHWLQTGECVALLG